jgi:hypothetical protein
MRAARWLSPQPARRGVAHAPGGPDRVDVRALRRRVTAMIGRLRAGAETRLRGSAARHLESGPPRRPTGGGSGGIGRNTMCVPWCLKSVCPCPASHHVSGGSCARNSRRRAVPAASVRSTGVEIAHLRQLSWGVAADFRFRRMRSSTRVLTRRPLGTTRRRLAQRRPRSCNCGRAAVSARRFRYLRKAALWRRRRSKRVSSPPGRDLLYGVGHHRPGTRNSKPQSSSPLGGARRPAGQLEGTVDEHWHRAARIDLQRDLDVFAETIRSQLDTGCAAAYRAMDRLRRLVRRPGACGLG